MGRRGLGRITVAGSDRRAFPRHADSPALLSASLCRTGRRTACTAHAHARGTWTGGLRERSGLGFALLRHQDDDHPMHRSVQSILETVRAYLGMDVAFVSEFAHGRRRFRHVSARSDTLRWRRASRIRSTKPVACASSAGACRRLSGTRSSMRRHVRFRSPTTCPSVRTRACRSCRAAGATASAARPTPAAGLRRPSDCARPPSPHTAAGRPA